MTQIWQTECVEVTTSDIFNPKREEECSSHPLPPPAPCSHWLVNTNIRWQAMLTHMDEDKTLVPAQPEYRSAVFCTSTESTDCSILFYTLQCYRLDLKCSPYDCYLRETQSSLAYTTVILSLCWTS